MERLCRQQPVASAISTQDRFFQHGKRLIHGLLQTSFFIQRPQGRTSAYRPTRRSRKNDNPVTDTLNPLLIRLDLKGPFSCLPTLPLPCMNNKRVK
ncbi:uncharacterized protein LOC143807994 [Ranitomeya variabilis]|uniref:uncharacterized protein LOC143807994 n=1 Tax=Ranitomeya variabilis TaxID=490064 RepID=UPI0040561C18